MDSKPITHTGDQHHLVKGSDIAPRMHNHTFFISQADVVARLLFHARQDSFFTFSDINNNCSRRLNVMWTHTHPALSHKERRIVPKIRFKFQKNSAMCMANRIYFIPKQDTERLVGYC